MLRLFVLVVRREFQHWSRQLQIDGFQSIRFRGAVTGFGLQIGEVIWDTVQAIPRLEGAALLGLTISAAVAYWFGA